MPNVFDSSTVTTPSLPTLSMASAITSPMAASASLQRLRARAGCDVAHALVHERLSENGGGRGAVTREIVGLGRDFLHELRAHVLERVVELDLACDRDAVVRDGRRAELLLEHDVAPTWAEGHLDGVGHLVDPGLQRAARVLVEFQELRHARLYFFFVFTMARTSRPFRIRRSSPSTVISVPPYFE